MCIFVTWEDLVIVLNRRFRLSEMLIRLVVSVCIFIYNGVL